MKLDLIQTLAFAGLILFLGYGIRRLISPLARYNIPAPVIGGLLVAIAITALRSRNISVIEFDVTLQSPLMVAFFTSIGFGASLALLRIGGPQVVIFFILATIFAVLQNVLGVAIATVMNVDPLLGVLAGSLTLTGGPATGLAFAPDFEAAGVQGAATLAVAAAMAGIVAGGVVGAPLATRLIEKHNLRGRRPDGSGKMESVAAHVVEDHLPEKAPSAPEGEDDESFALLRAIALILVAMWAGSWLSAWFTSMNVKLPAYIGAMLVAAVLRNFDDATGLLRISQRTIDDIGNVALSFFLAMALMTLKLWEVAALAVPLMIILAGQVLLIAVTVGMIYRLMGKDYDAAVMGGGFAGFMLGTTANAMANMRSLVERYGLAPRAFLVVPMVGAFFIDFTNALIITAALNLFR